MTDQCQALFRAARAEGDVLSEQFMLWFLKEQVEEISPTNTFLKITERAAGDWFQIEEHLAREPQNEDEDSSAHKAAGGFL